MANEKTESKDPRDEQIEQLKKACADLGRENAALKKTAAEREALAEKVRTEGEDRPYAIVRLNGGPGNVTEPGDPVPESQMPGLREGEHWVRGRGHALARIAQARPCATVKHDPPPDFSKNYADIEAARANAKK